MKRKYSETRIQYYVVPHYEKITGGKRKKRLCGCNASLYSGEYTRYINESYARLNADPDGRCLVCGGFIYYKLNEKEIKELNSGNPT